MEEQPEGERAAARAHVYTINETAALLKISPDWLRHKVASREVPHVRLGRNIRFSQANLDQILRDGIPQLPEAKSPPVRRRRQPPSRRTQRAVEGDH